MPNFRTSANVPPSRRSAFESILLYGLLSVFTLAGLGVLGLSIRDLSQGRPNAWFGLGFACVWLLGCAVALWFLIRSGRAAAGNDSGFGPFLMRRSGPREEWIRGSTPSSSLVAFTDDRFKLRLTCTRVTITRRGSSKSPDSESRESLWIGERIQHPDGKRPDGRLELPFAFVIPAGLPESCETNPRIEWCIEATASVPGLDFRESFPLHVSDRSDVEPFTTDERSHPIRGGSVRPRGSAPFQAEPDRAAGRIEADRRVGPVWPGMAGIGIVPLGAAGFLAAVPHVARRLQHIVSALVMIVVVAFIASTFTRGRGLDFLGSILTKLPTLMNGWIWVAAPVGGCIVVAAGLTAWHRHWHLNRFGISFLRLATLPVKAGAMMKGTLEIPRSVVPKGGFSFRFLRARTRWFAGQFFGPAAETGWTGDWITFPGRVPGNGSTEVPFELPLPASLPESSRGELPWQWYVEVSAPVPGLDYIARFVVPVQDVRMTG